MSVWPSQLERLAQPRVSPRQAPLAAIQRFDLRFALRLLCLICILIVEGMAIVHSYLWATPLVCLLFVAVAIDIPLIPFIGLTFLVRILTDDQSSSTSRHSGALNLSALIAGLFILVAIGLLIRRRQALWPTIVTGLALALWTLVAVGSHGASTETIREGIREMSILALAVIVCNARGVLRVSVATRMIQVVGFPSALLAIYQVGTHTGALIGGEIRSNGTFTHPNSAAAYFAIATTVSLWRYLDNGRRRSDLFFAATYAAGTVATFSLGGLAALLVMLITFGALRPGSFRLKVSSFAVAMLIAIGFMATPLGAARIANESSTNLSSTQARGNANTSLAWRFYKWRTLIPEWERAPILGQGLGSTVTAEGNSENSTAGKVPHDEYVRYLVETGLIGFFVLIGGLVALLRGLARRGADTATRNTGVLGRAIVVGLMVDALASNTLLYTPAAYAAAIIVAAILRSDIDTDAVAIKGAA